jgi:hypothetical protein
MMSTLACARRRVVTCLWRELLEWSLMKLLLLAVMNMLLSLSLRMKLLFLFIVLLWARKLVVVSYEGVLPARLTTHLVCRE